MKSRKIKGDVLVSMVVFVTSVLFTSVLGVRQYNKFTTTPVWVAATQLSAGETLSWKAIKQIRVDEDSSDRLIRDPKLLIGKKLRVDKNAEAGFYADEFILGRKSSLAEVVPAGRVLYTLVTQKVTFPHTHLRRGDRIDVLVRGSRGVRVVASDVRILGSLKTGMNSGRANAQGRSVLMPKRTNAISKTVQTGNPLAVAVYPEDVYPLANIGKSETVSIVLHSNADVSSGRTLQIRPGITQRRVEVVSGEARKSIFVSL